MAGILHALPSFNIHTTPMGCGIEVAWGKYQGTYIKCFPYALNILHRY